MIPSTWVFVLLALAAFRVWKLVGDDAILDRPREWLLAKIPTHDLEYFITCPWCAGFWIALAWWAAWLVWPYETTVVAVLFALSAVVGFLGVIIDSLE